MLAQGEMREREEAEKGNEREGGEEEEEETVHSLVETVNRMAAEKKLSVDGLALYHLIAPMFPGQSFQVLRQRYLKYRGMLKSTVPNASFHREEPPPPLPDEDANNDGHGSTLPNAVEADEIEHKDRRERETGEGEEKGREADNADGRAEQGMEEGENNIPDAANQPATPMHGQEWQVEPMASVTKTAEPASNSIHPPGEMTLGMGPASPPHSSHSVDAINMAEAPSTVVVHDESGAGGRKPSISKSAEKRVRKNREKTMKTTKKGKETGKGEEKETGHEDRHEKEGQKGHVVVEMVETDIGDRRHRAKVSQDGSCPSKEALISEIIAEMMLWHQVPREVVLYALLTHSGSVTQAHHYLADASRRAQWDFRDDLAILEDGATRSTRLQRRTSAEIASRRTFLARLCDPPPPSSPVTGK